MVSRREGDALTSVLAVWYRKVFMCPVGAGSLVKIPWICLHVQVSWEGEGEHRSKAPKACGAGLWRDAAESRGWAIQTARATSRSAQRFLWHGDFSEGANLQL